MVLYNKPLKSYVIIEFKTTKLTPEAAGQLNMYMNLHTAHLSARELAMKMIHEVFETIEITAIAGIGTNFYFCKVEMDIVAKHIPAETNK